MTPDETTHDPVGEARPNEVVAIAEFLRRRRAVAALWLDADYRRDAFRMLVIQLRTVIGLRVWLGVALFAFCFAYPLARPLAAPAEAYHILSKLCGLVAILFAAPIYASDQRQGTFELLWLATGSQAAMLRTKVITLMVALTVLTLPPVLAFWWFLDGALPVLLTMACLMVNALLIIGVMAHICTFLPQAWAGGLVGASIIGPALFLMEDWDAKLNIFATSLAPENAAVGRPIAVVIALVLLYNAAERLKHALRG